MAGETVLPVETFPHDFQLLMRADNPLVAPVARWPIGVTDRDMVVDEARIRYATAGGAAETATLSYVPSGTAIGGTKVDVSAAGLIDRTADTNYDLVIDATTNIVPAGSLLFLTLSSAATVKGVLCTLRVRSQKK